MQSYGLTSPHSRFFVGALVNLLRSASPFGHHFFLVGFFSTGWITLPLPLPPALRPVFSPLHLEVIVPFSSGCSTLV